MDRRRLGVESLEFWVLVVVWSPKVCGQSFSASGTSISPCFGGDN